MKTEIETEDALCRKIAELKAENERLRGALVDVKSACLCDRTMRGFNYGQEHKVKGRAGAGKRWKMPRELISEALAPTQQTEGNHDER